MALVSGQDRTYCCREVGYRVWTCGQINIVTKIENIVGQLLLIDQESSIFIIMGQGSRARRRRTTLSGRPSRTNSPKGLSLPVKFFLEVIIMFTWSGGWSCRRVSQACIDYCKRVIMTSNWVDKSALIGEKVAGLASGGRRRHS